MSAWILWRAIIRMGYPEIWPLWKTKPDIYESKEECQIAMSIASLRFSEDLKEDRDVIEIVTVTENSVGYVIKDATHPSRKRDVVAHWACYPAGFNPNDQH